MRHPALSRLLASFALLLGTVAVHGPARAQCDLTATTGGVVVPGPPAPAVAVNSSPFGAFQASADYGALSVSANVALSGHGSDSGMNAIAEFSDQLTITAPGVPDFTPGILTAVIDTRGTPEVLQSATGSGVAQGMSASYQVFLLKNGGTVHQISGGRLYNNGTVPPWATTGSVPAPGVQEVDISFSFGIPFTLSTQLLANAGGSNIIPVGATGTLTGDAQMTFDWNGMSSIRGAGGTEYLGVAAVASCSGHDWKGNLAPTGVADIGPSALAARLEPGFPNPFRRSTTLTFSLAAAGPVSVELFDVAGRRVRTLVSGFRSAGRHTALWDGLDAAGRSVPGGVYFVRLAGPRGADQGTIVHLK